MPLFSTQSRSQDTFAMPAELQNALFNQPGFGFMYFNAPVAKGSAAGLVHGDTVVCQQSYPDNHTARFFINTRSNKGKSTARAQGLMTAFWP
jgi:hypothetical protein